MCHAILHHRLSARRLGYRATPAFQLACGFTPRTSLLAKRRDGGKYSLMSVSRGICFLPLYDFSIRSNSSAVILRSAYIVGCIGSILRDQEAITLHSDIVGALYIAGIELHTAIKHSHVNDSECKSQEDQHR